jgi:tetratricopeptide (TPR) repeat protein
VLSEKAKSRRKIREDKEAKEAIEREEKLKKGREGAGEKENYKHYCRHCRVEYPYDTPTCVRCQKATVTYADRRKELLERVEDYKSAKLRKQERKKKWEMWKKTKAIFWKKTATDYEKWDYFTDSEDEFEKLEQEAKPVLPENDPNFRALKADLDQRSNNRRQRAKEANELKLKANKLMKDGKHAAAIQTYTEAIEVYRSNKYLWSNRALAYIKLGKFKEAEDDCTKMLEYAELLEDGYEKDKELNFKFFARKSMANVGLKQFDRALNDIENALKLIPEDKSALETRREILQKLESEQKLEDLEKKIQDTEALSKNFTADQLKVKSEIDTWINLTTTLMDTSSLDNLKDYDYMNMQSIVSDEDLKLYFLKVGGLDSYYVVLKKDLYSVLTREDKLNFLTFVRATCEQNHLYSDGLTENAFIHRVIKKLAIILKQLFPKSGTQAEQIDQKDVEEEKTTDQLEDEAKENALKKQQIDEMYDYKILELEELVELLISMTDNRSVRGYLRDKKSLLLIEIFEIIQENIMSKENKEYSVLSSVLSFYSNVCMSDIGLKNTDIRDHLVKHYARAIFTFSARVLTRPQTKFLMLKNSCLAFIVNLSTDKNFRDHVLNLIVTYEGLHKDHKVSSLKVEPGDFNHVALFMQNLGLSFNYLYKRTAEGKMKDHQFYVSRFYEHATGVLLNFFFQLTDKATVGHMKSHFRRWRLDQVSVEVLHNILKFRLNAGVLLDRFVNVVAKLGFDAEANDNNAKMLYIICEIMLLFEDDTTKNTDFFTDSIRFLAAMFQEFKELGKTAIELTFLKAKGLNSQIRSIISNELKSTMRYTSNYIDSAIHAALSTRP